MDPPGAARDAAGPSARAPAHGEIGSAPVPTWNPASWVRGRFRQWWQSRLPLQDSCTLTQRNVYILPTGPGFMLGATLLVLLIASINYQLNLGYVLTFLLAGCAVVGMHVGHANLRGITLHLQPPQAQFAGASVALTVELQSQRRSPRYGLGLAVLGSEQWCWSDLAPQGHARVQLAFLAPQRGLQRVPTLTAQTRFPLGTFRVWTVWRPAAQVLVYPRPEDHPPALPSGTAHASEGASARAHRTDEYDGVRAYRRGDARKLIVWKKAAKAGEWVSRDTQTLQDRDLWLDLAACGASLNLEQRLARLCAWVLRADAQSLRYGLRLGAQELPPAAGAEQRLACLRALALYQAASS